MKRPVYVAIFCALLLAVGLGTGSAYAYFTSSGNGSGTAATGTLQNVTIDAATGTPASLLQPGGTADLTLTLDNPNPFAVTIVGIQGNGSPTPAGGVGTCVTTGVTVPLLTGLNVTLPSGTGQTVHIPNAAAMSTASDSGCQGASFHLPVIVTVHKP